MIRLRLDLRSPFAPFNPIVIILQVSNGNLSRRFCVFKNLGTFATVGIFFFFYYYYLNVVNVIMPNKQWPHTTRSVFGCVGDKLYEQLEKNRHVKYIITVIQT